MKAQTKAIVASIMVIALALTAVSGVTYSWFSDSDEGRIDVSTATIDVSFDIVSAEVNDTSGNPINATNDTKVEVNTADNSLDVINLMANRSIKATVNLTNSSNVTIGYRMYLDASELTVISPYMTFFVSDGINKTQLSANQGISFIKGNETTLVTDEPFCNATISEAGTVAAPATTTLYLIMNVSSLAPSINENGPIKIILEAYQHDASVDPVEPATPIPIGSGVDVSPTSGNEYGINNDSSSSDIKTTTIKFDDQALSNIGGSTLTVSFEQSSLTTFQLAEVGTINVSLTNGGDNVSILGGIAVITIIVDGEVSSPSILYINGETTEQMAITSSTFDGNKTTISFTTTHFSKFTLIDAVAMIDGQYYRTLTDAMTNGGSISLLADAETSSKFKISNDCSIDLNGKTWRVGNNTELVNGSNLTVKNGTVLRETYSGYVDVRPGTTTGSMISYENVTFVNTYKTKTYGPCTDRVESALEFCPENGGSATFSFVGCTFNNSQILFEGLSGTTGSFTADFDRCTFNNLGTSAGIEVASYLTGTITVKDCNFNLTATATMYAVKSSNSVVTWIFEGNNAVDGVTATASGEDGSVDQINVMNPSVKVYSINTTNGTKVNGLDTVTVSGIATK